MRFRTQILLLTITAMAVFGVLLVFYSTRVSQTSNRRVEEFTESSMGQIENALGLIFSRAQNTASYFSASVITRQYLLEEDSYEAYLLHRYFSDFTRAAINTDGMIENVILYDREGNNRFYYNAINMPLYNDINKIKEESRVSGGEVRLHYDAERRHLACITSVFLDAPIIPIESRRAGQIIIMINLDAVVKTMREAGNMEEVRFHLLDAEGSLVASNTGDDTPIEEGNGIIRMERQVGNTGMRIVGYINRGKVLRDFEPVRFFVVVAGAVFVFIYVAIALLYHHRIAKPVHRLVSEVSEIGRENRHRKRLEGQYNSELSGLAENINSMLTSIDTMSHRIFEAQQKMYEAELLHRDTELYGLMSQINPHFLFNTIQIIGGIALLNNVPVLPRVCNSMADIFRYSVRDSYNVPLREELEIVRKYLQIMEVRFSGRLNWKVDTHRTNLNAIILKMIIQPLVENTINHCVEKKETPSHIAIDITEEEDSLYIRISDDGPGIDGAVLAQLTSMMEDKLRLEQEMRSRKRIGIANIRYRCLLLYGDKSEMGITSDSGGTVITLRLPLLLR
ncbi:histidine kinase [Ruminococcaceae bacterium OttesenSCG-928-L11]|nr:histidine kinase [Ruminococcaceae bacterium OttesenSCG-928-L11]